MGKFSKYRGFTHNSFKLKKIARKIQKPTPIFRRHWQILSVIFSWACDDRFEISWIEGRVKELWISPKNETDSSHKLMPLPSINDTSDILNPANLLFDAYTELKKLS